MPNIYVLAYEVYLCFTCSPLAALPCPDALRLLSVGEVRVHGSICCYGIPVLCKETGDVCRGVWCPRSVIPTIRKDSVGSNHVEHRGCDRSYLAYCYMV